MTLLTWSLKILMYRWEICDSETFEKLRMFAIYQVRPHCQELPGNPRTSGLELSRKFIWSSSSPSSQCLICVSISSSGWFSPISNNYALLKPLGLQITTLGKRISDNFKLLLICRRSLFRLRGPWGHFQGPPKDRESINYFSRKVGHPKMGWTVLSPCPSWGADLRVCLWAVTVGWLRAVWNWAPSLRMQSWPPGGFGVQVHGAWAPSSHLKWSDTEPRAQGSLPQWSYFHPASTFWGVDREEEGAGEDRTERWDPENCNSGAFQLGSFILLLCLCLVCPAMLWQSRYTVAVITLCRGKALTCVKGQGWWGWPLLRRPAFWKGIWRAQWSPSFPAGHVGDTGWRRGHLSSFSIWLPSPSFGDLARLPYVVCWGCWRQDLTSDWSLKGGAWCVLPHGEGWHPSHSSPGKEEGLHMVPGK